MFCDICGTAAEAVDDLYCTECGTRLIRPNTEYSQAKLFNTDGARDQTFFVISSLILGFLVFPFGIALGLWYVFSKKNTLLGIVAIIMASLSFGIVLLLMALLVEYPSSEPLDDSLGVVHKNELRGVKPVVVPTPTTIPTLAMDLRETLKLYRNNPLAAESRYIGKLVTVIGLVDEIDQVSFRVIPLDSDELQMSGLECDLSDNQKNKLMSLRDNQIVTVEGTVTDITEFFRVSILLQNCIIRDASDVKSKGSSDTVLHGTVTATNLLNAYDSNPVQADRNYKNQRYEITGIVSSIQQMEEVVDLRISSGSLSLASVVCKVNDADSVLQLYEGSPAKVSGVITGTSGIFGIDVVVIDCKIDQEYQSIQPVRIPSPTPMPSPTMIPLPSPTSPSRPTATLTPMPVPTPTIRPTSTPLPTPTPRPVMCTAQQKHLPFLLYGRMSGTTEKTLSAWVDGEKLAEESGIRGNYMLSVPVCKQDGTSIIGRPVTLKINGSKRGHEPILRAGMSHKLDF